MLEQGGFMPVFQRLLPLHAVFLWGQHHSNSLRCSFHFDVTTDAHKTEAMIQQQNHLLHHHGGINPSFGWCSLDAASCGIDASQHMIFDYTLIPALVIFDSKTNNDGQLELNPHHGARSSSLERPTI